MWTIRAVDLRGAAVVLDLVVAAAAAAAAALVVVVVVVVVVVIEVGGLEVSVLLLPWEQMLAWDLKVACGVLHPSLQKVMLLYLVAALVALAAAAAAAAVAATAAAAAVLTEWMPAPPLGRISAQCIGSGA